ncbi:unnamed protein product [Pleuronectes platessa]|uniref:Uncharacterized protein n=1 Tax=Pleuronectes platessa TaxID=8262 RepID=A0A9N7V0C0_PLEPL|nr:unnamed protein product [Pleuronectes platessa]
MDKINIHTATKTRAPQSPGHLFDQRLLHMPEQKVHKCFSDVNWQVRSQAPVSGEMPSRISSPPFLRLPSCQWPLRARAGRVERVSQSDCDKGTRIKFPDSYLTNLL